MSDSLLTMPCWQVTSAPEGLEALRSIRGIRALLVRGDREVQLDQIGACFIAVNLRRPYHAKTDL